MTLEIVHKALFPYIKSESSYLQGSENQFCPKEEMKEQVAR